MCACCKGACLLWHACWGQRKTSWVDPCLAPFLKHCLLFCCCCCCCLLLQIPGQLDRNSLEILSLPPCRRSTGMTDTYHYTQIYMNSGDSNSAPHDYMAEPCPLLLFLRQSLTMQHRLTWNSRFSCLKQLSAGIKVLYCCYTRFPSFHIDGIHANKGNKENTFNGIWRLGVREQQWIPCRVSKIKPGNQ